MFNPFGNPTQIEVSKDFEPAKTAFVRDLDLGDSFNNIVNSRGFENAAITIQLSSSLDGISHTFNFKGNQLREKIQNATKSLDQWEASQKKVDSKALYQTVKRSFIAEPFSDEEKKVLKIPTNPQFAPDFLGIAGAGGANKTQSEEENFNVKKVWIDPGCIVCDACETIYPEVFHVTEDACIILDAAPLDNGLLVEEAAEACPVEVIKYERVGK